MSLQIHKRTKLSPEQQKEMFSRRDEDNVRVAALAEEYHVSRPTYKRLARGRKWDFSVQNSTNARFRNLRYGMKRLAGIEKDIENKLKKKAKRYNKNYPGEMIHVDCKRLPLLEG